MNRTTEYDGPEKRTGPEDRRESALKQYFEGFLVKLMENMSSAKVWFFLLPFIFSSAYMAWIIWSQVKFVKQLVDTAITDPTILNALNATFTVTTNTFIGWCTFNVSLVGTIVVVRETFKVTKIKAINEANENTIRNVKNFSA